LDKYIRFVERDFEFISLQKIHLSGTGLVNGELTIQPSPRFVLTNNYFAIRVERKTFKCELNEKQYSIILLSL